MTEGRRFIVLLFFYGGLKIGLGDFGSITTILYNVMQKTTVMDRQEKPVTCIFPMSFGAIFALSSDTK